MLRLDHFVLHTDQGKDRLERLQQQISPMGFNFIAGGGKSTKSFQVTNIWMGAQYFEMVWLKMPDANWREAWVKQYNQGQRGIAGLMFMTDRLDALRQGLVERGLNPSEPERISISFLFNWFKKVFPWRNVYVGPIPGTDLTISFQEMDSERAIASMNGFMVPNTRNQGIHGISTAIVRQRFSDEAWSFLQGVFQSIEISEERLTAALDEGTMVVFERNADDQLTVELHAVTDRSELVGKSWTLENVTVVTKLAASGTV